MLIIVGCVYISGWRGEWNYFYFIDKLFKKISLDKTNLNDPTGWVLGLNPDPSINARIGVVDFLDMDLPEFLCFMSSSTDCRWFIFNMSDVYISCGFCILIASMYLKKRNEKKVSQNKKHGQQKESHKNDITRLDRAKTKPKFWPQVEKYVCKINYNKVNY